MFSNNKRNDFDKPPPLMLFLPTEPINDSYRATRGGWSDILELHCNKCDEYVMTYQKDGEGPLKRCYLDRILHPAQLKELQNKEFDINTFEKLQCVNCHHEIAVPMMYEKEMRPAFRITQDNSYFHTVKPKV